MEVFCELYQYITCIDHQQQETLEGNHDQQLSEEFSADKRFNFTQDHGMQRCCARKQYWLVLRLIQSSVS